MKIEVLDCDWGGAYRGDIQKLLEVVASHIVRELREPFVDTIRVMNMPTQPPRAFYRSPGATSHKVNLTAKNCYWCQFVYQFGHEFCHVLSGHGRLRDNPNNWFHESICELASFFVLRRVAKRWPADPPIANWVNYSTSLDDYAECVADRYRQALPKGSFSTWLSTNENDLRQNPYLREKNGVVALRHGWNAVRRLPVSKGLIEEYIEVWKAEVQSIDRPFVESVYETLFVS